MDLTEMSQEEIETLRRQVEETNRQVGEIHRAIVGGDYNQESAILPRLRKAEDYIEKDKKLKWMGAGVIAFVTWVASNAKDLWHQVFR